MPFKITQSSNRSNLLENLIGDTTGLQNLRVTSLTGDGRAFGTFKGGIVDNSLVDDPFRLTSGIALSTGRVVDIAGGNISSMESGTDFSPNGNAGDTIKLNIDFFADGTKDKLFFQYVFGSEEFYEFAGKFNDSFSLTLNGINYAVLPDVRRSAVSINNLASSSLDRSSPYLLNNLPNEGFAKDTIRLNAFTVPLIFEAPLKLNQVNNLEIIVQDSRDGIFDSAVMIKAGTLGTIRPIDIPVDVNNPTKILPLPNPNPVSNLNPIVNPIVGEFTSGAFTTDTVGKIQIDYLFDGGSYRGEVGIFSLDQMQSLLANSIEFVREAARRSVSNTSLGHVVISDITDGAKYSGKMGRDRKNFNRGDYKGVQSFDMKPGSAFAILFVPNGSIQQLLDDPTRPPSQPFFSLVKAGSTDIFQNRQLAAVDDNKSIWAFEDLAINQKSDRDYNDVVFRIAGASTISTPSLSELVNPKRDWRSSKAGQNVLSESLPLGSALQNPMISSQQNDPFKVTNVPTAPLMSTSNNTIAP
jgi:Domain of unknown function (DUF4114)